MRRILVMLAVAAVAIATACNNKDETPATAGQPQTLRFAVIPKALDIPVFNYARIGAERAA